MNSVMNTKVLLRVMALFGCLSLVASDALAQGFSVYEQSTCVMGRGGATVAQTCGDGSAIFFNPAGVAGMQGAQFSAGGTLIMAGGSFTFDDTGEEEELQNEGIAAPHAYGTYGFNDQLSAGIGVYVPYGLGTVWEQDFEGAFLGYDNSLESIYIQPTVGYAVTDRLSVGAGLTVVLGSVTLTQLVDLSQQPVPSPDVPEGTTFAEIGIPFHTAFADARMEAGGATGFGGNFGLQFQATDWLSVGARFMTNVALEYEGDAIFEPVETGIVLPENNPFDAPAGTPLDAVLEPQFGENGLLADQTVTTEITMPAQGVLGVSVEATPELMLFVDYQWTNWSVFDSIALEFERPELSTTRYESFEDTHGLRLGAEYTLNQDWMLRAGFITHTSAAPDETITPLLPEAHRNEFSFGVGWQPAEMLGINLAYQYINQNDRRGRVREAPEGEDPTTALNSGLYRFNAHLIGATVSLQF